MLETNTSDAADRVLDHFDAFEEKVEEEIDQTLREAKDEAQQRVPVDTGALRDDISIDLDKDKIYNTLHYAPHQDQGTIHIEPTWYLTDSVLDAFISSVERLRKG